MIEAWSRLPAAARDTPLTLIGDGPLSQSLMELAERLRVPARFLGAQPRSVVLKHMSEAAVLAFPSTRAANGDAEGMGIVVMEAQALGLAVVAFDSGPAREAIADGVSGLLVKDEGRGRFLPTIGQGADRYRVA